MRDGGKGDKPRPLSIPIEQFDSNWDSIFKKKEPHELKTIKTLEANKNKASEAVLDPILHTIVASDSNL